MSQDFCDKVSEALKGTKWTEEHRLNVLQSHKENDYHPWNYGIPCSEEAKEKISQANIGRKHFTQEEKIKLHDRWMGNNNPNATPVYNVELEQCFLTYTEGAVLTGARVSNICRCVKGEHHTAGGYHWRQATPEEIENCNIINNIKE